MKHSVKILFRHGRIRSTFKSHGYDHIGNAIARRDAKIAELRALGYEILAFNITSLRAA